MIHGPVYQGVLKRLAALGIALGAPSAALAGELESIPMEVATALIEAEEADGVTGSDRTRLLLLLVNDPRPAVRARIAERLGQRPAVLDEDMEALLDRLVRDPDPSVRQAALVAIRRLLPELSALDRSALVGRWATSPEAAHRLATAWILEQRVPVLWADLIVEHLTHDPIREVRLAAHDAAVALGFGEDPEGAA